MNPNQGSAVRNSLLRAWRRSQPGRIGLSELAFVVAVLFLGGGCLAPRQVEGIPQATITGVVLAQDTGEPIANTQVLVSSPAVDMRGQREPVGGIFDAKTDRRGRFKLRVPRSPAISLNAFAPGYEEAAGMLMNGHWELDSVPLATNEVLAFVIKLQPALYATGVVVDESGRSCAGVSVEATLRDGHSTSYIELAATRTDGQFEIYDIPTWPTRTGNRGGTRAQLTFRHPTKLTACVTNIYALPESMRTNLKVTLRTGCALRGVVVTADGKPLRGGEVKAMPLDTEAAARRCVPDEQGGYELRALPEGEVLLRAHTGLYDQLVEQTVRLAGADAEVDLRLRPVTLKKEPKPVRVLGMDLVDVTPELRDVYHLWSPNGVLVLNSVARSDIGSLRRGMFFWMVGNKKISSVREMIDEILRINEIEPQKMDSNEGCRGDVRVVYALRDNGGTMTMGMKLTDAEVAELKRLQRERLGGE